MGITGSGKSTIANAFIKGPSNISLNDGLFNAVQPIIYNNETIFKIGHQVKSETKAPKFCPLEEDKGDIFLVDGPGINDNNLKHEYSNQTAIKYVLSNCKSMKLVLIMDANSINLASPKSFIEFVTAFIRKLSPAAFQNEHVKDIVIPYFVNF